MDRFEAYKNQKEYLIRSYLKQGVDGFLLKFDSALELDFALQEVMSGQTFYSSGVAKILSGTGAKSDSQLPDLSVLTKAELSILALIGEGFSAQEIGQKRNTSEKTVNRQKQNIMDKLDIHRESNLVRVAILAGLA